MIRGKRRLLLAGAMACSMTLFTAAPAGATSPATTGAYLGASLGGQIFYDNDVSWAGGCVYTTWLGWFHYELAFEDGASLSAIEGGVYSFVCESTALIEEAGVITRAPSADEPGRTAGLSVGILPATGQFLSPTGDPLAFGMVTLTEVGSGGDYERTGTEVRVTKRYHYEIDTSDAQSRSGTVTLTLAFSVSPMVGLESSYSPVLALTCADSSCG